MNELIYYANLHHSIYFDLLRRISCLFTSDSFSNGHRTTISSHNIPNSILRYFRLKVLKMKSSLLVSIIVGVLCTTRSAHGRYSNLHSANDNGVSQYGQHQHPFGHPERMLVEGPFDLAEYLLSTCPAQKPIDYEAVRNTGRCMQRLMEEPKLTQLLLLIASNQFQEFSTKACKFLPELKTCLDYVIDYFDQCHDNSQLDKVVETILKFGCSIPKDGLERTNNLGDFLAHGGLSCFDLGKFTKCIQTALNKGVNNACTILEKIRSCESAFEDCASPKPWETISRGLDELKAELKCDSSEQIK